MLFSKCSLLTGVDASAAQNSSVTKTCSQCGAVLRSSVRACNFCDSSFSVGPSSWEDPPNISPAQAGCDAAATGGSGRRSVISHQKNQDAAWRGELAQRLDAYRTRRRKYAPNADQAHFSFDDAAVGKPPP